VVFVQPVNQRQGFLVSTILHLTILMILVSRQYQPGKAADQADPTQYERKETVFLPPASLLKQLAPRPMPRPRRLPTVLTRRNPPAVLTTADLLTCEARLDRHRARHVATLVGLPPNRVKALRGGVEALLLLLDWYGLALLHVSHEGLRHGMLLAYLERGRDWWRDPPHEIT